MRDKWNDVWHWSWSRAIRGGVSSRQLEDLLMLLQGVSFSNDQDHWRCCLGGFSVKEIRLHIDNLTLPYNNMETRWSKFLPKMLNILVWKIL